MKSQISNIVVNKKCSLLPILENYRLQFQDNLARWFWVAQLSCPQFSNCEAAANAKEDVITKAGSNVQYMTK